MRSYKQLTQEQRYHIEAYRQTGKNVSQIANKLKVHRSTISREMQRNSPKGIYRAKSAHHRTVSRRKKACKPTKMTPSLQKKICEKLEEKWSPEQIVGYLWWREGIKVSIQTIYSFVQQDKAQGGALFSHLRFGKKRRKKKYGSKEKRGQIKNRISIEQRPEIVDQKVRCGDWEGDTIIGKGRRAGLLTLVERKTKFTLMVKIASKHANTTADLIIDALRPLKKVALSLTTDNGKEFAAHEKITQALDLPVFFAHPYCSWERGLNENTNGLIRQYFDKKTDFSQVSKEMVAFVQKQLNTRPRKALEFDTPQQRFVNSLIGT